MRKKVQFPTKNQFCKIQIDKYLPLSAKYEKNVFVNFKKHNYL